MVVNSRIVIGAEGPHRARNPGTCKVFRRCPSTVSCTVPSGESPNFHWEIKGRFRKRGGFGERTLVPVFVPGEHPPKPPFWKPPFCQHQKGLLGDKRAVSKRVVLANVPSFRFSFWGNIRRNHPFWAPQTCVYPDVCLGIAHVSGKGPLPGQGVWQIHNVSALFAPRNL